MERDVFLPLGSIVILQGGVKKVMVMARGLAAEHNGELQYFEYGGCLYPEGLVGEQILHFNRENILKLVAEGFSDEEDELMSQNISDWIKRTGYKKGDPYEWNTGK